MMTIRQVMEIVDGKVLIGEDRLDARVDTACGSDLMSDVLAFVKEKTVLITGLINPHVLRTAEMLDITCIVFSRGKLPSDCVRGAVHSRAAGHETEDRRSGGGVSVATILEKSFPVEAGAYTTAGEASTTIKRTLKQLGISAEVLRHVSVACYEVELNLVIHSMGGTLTLLVDPEKVTLISKDVGPGIPDIEKAMTEGFSTASAEARTLGFGAGMGLPNMKRNATEFDIQSEVGVGTTITMSFALT